jgi:hypothetical protein
LSTENFRVSHATNLYFIEQAQAGLATCLDMPAYCILDVYAHKVCVKGGHAMHEAAVVCTGLAQPPHKRAGRA